MKKYVCTVCGYEYDPEVGDPDNGIAPGTAFEDLPEDWVCPLCEMCIRDRLEYRPAMMSKIPPSVEITENTPLLAAIKLVRACLLYTSSPHWIYFR